MPAERLLPLNRTRGAIDVLMGEMPKSGTVGVVAFVIDLGGTTSWCSAHT